LLTSLPVLDLLAAALQHRFDGNALGLPLLLPVRKCF
jgi:hypothetical protein